MDTRLAVCLLTYKRTEYACQTLKSLLRNLRYDGFLHLHIADDGSEQSHVMALLRLIRDREFSDKVVNLTVTNSNQGGYGRNVNLATQVLHDAVDYILMLEDDWELVGELNADELIRDMAIEPRINSVRLGYLSYTQSLRGEVCKPNYRAYLLLDPASPEPHVFAGHPRLEKVNYQREVGPWPENLSPGDTEFAVAHKKAARQGVAWPMDLVQSWGSLFAHIGTVRSY